MGNNTVHTASDTQTRGLFVTFGNFSLSNTRLIEALEARHPNVMFNSFDISAEMRRRPLMMARCLFATVREYGLGSLRSRTRLRYRFLRSCGFFDAAHRLIAEKVATDGVDFTLQTQSLFDAASAGVPNIVYTDHVATARLNQSWDSGTGRPSARWLALEKTIYDNAEHVFVFGNSIRRQLIETYGRHPETVSAIGAGALPAVDPDTNPARYAAPNILFVGVEWDRKGGPELIAAFEKLRARLPGATLTIIGVTPVITVEGCEVLGRVPREELDHYFRTCSCFCMPSRLEPFGLVYVEAMKHGRPVVATTVGDIPDIVAHGHTGLLVPPGDVDALAEALHDVLSAPVRAREMGLAGMDQARKFSWDFIAQKIASKLPGAEAPENLRRTS